MTVWLAILWMNAARFTGIIGIFSDRQTAENSVASRFGKPYTTTEDQRDYMFIKYLYPGGADVTITEYPIDQLTSLYPPLEQ